MSRVFTRAVTMIRRSWMFFAAIGLLFTFQPAQAQSIPNFTPEQLQRLGRDLSPTNAEDFFRKGREQLEREIRLLDRRVLSSDQTILKVDPTLRDPERLQPFSPQVVPLRSRFQSRQSARF